MGLPVSVSTADNQGLAPVIFRDRQKARDILNCRRTGGSKVMCAQKGGIARRTLYNWLERAEAIREARMDDPLISVTPYDKDYLWFIAEWEDADYLHKHKHLKLIEGAAEEGNVGASQWLLTKLHPEEFGNNPPDRVMQPRDDARVIMMNIPAIPRREIEVAEIEVIEDDE